MKGQINIRASVLLQRQLDELTDKLGTSITETVSIAIDRMYQQEIKTMNTYSTGNTDLTLEDMQAAWFANTANDSHREAPDAFPTIDRAITEFVGLQFNTAAEARAEYERGAKVLEQYAVFMSSRTTIPFINGKPTESRTENAAAWYVTDSGHIATTPAYRFIYFYQRKDVAQAA